MNPLTAALRFHELHSLWLGDGLRPVDKDLAQHRANVCLQCPKHDSSRPVLEWFEEKVALTVRRQVEYKNDHLKLRVDGEKSLHLCGVCSCVLRLKCWVPLEHIKETTDIPMLPEHCWIKVESEAQ